MQNTPRIFHRIPTNHQINQAINDGDDLQLTDSQIKNMKVGHGLVIADWDEDEKLGYVKALAVIKGIDYETTKISVATSSSDVTLKPNPAGRRWWKNPSLRFADNVADHYMLPDLFAEHFPEYQDMVFGSVKGVRSWQQNMPQVIQGYIYVIKSEYGFKIGKTVNLKGRARLFEVKLPFHIKLVYSAFVNDYTSAESHLHRLFSYKRLEGEWFDLNESDLTKINELCKQW